MSEAEHADAPDKWDAARDAALDRDGHACRFCGVDDGEHREEHGRGLHVHHIIPRKDGGTDHLSNLLTVCYACHGTIEAATRRVIDATTPAVSPANVGAVRGELDEMQSDCRWLWHDELPQLSDLPAIEDRNLPGAEYSPRNVDGVTDRELACYILGKIDGYSHAGSNIEAALEYPADEWHEQQREHMAGIDEPLGSFWTPEGEPDPEFSNWRTW